MFCSGKRLKFCLEVIWLLGIVAIENTHTRDHRAAALISVLGIDKTILGSEICKSTPEGVLS